MIVRLDQERPVGQPTLLDPSALLAAKSLLAPLLIVTTLVLCLFAAHEPVRGHLLLLGALTFLAAAGVIELKGIAPEPLSPRALLDVCSWLGQWWVGRKLGWLAQRGSPHAAVIVGVSDVGLRLEKVLTSNPLLHTRVLGFFEDRSDLQDDPRFSNGGRFLGALPALPDYVRAHGVQQVYITLPIMRDPRTLALVDSLRDSTASIYFVPDLYAFGLVQARFDVVGDVPVIAVGETPIVGVNNLAKRLCDLLLSGLALLLLSPVFLVVALGIRLTSPGPVLFRQRRYGLDGAEIKIYKFRSMTVIEDGDTGFSTTMPGDTRLTRFGALLRKCSLDELPQLINVLLGNMSLVGPRPHVVAMNEKYRKLIPGYMVRHKIKPGITGWAQVNGARGGDDLELMHRRLAYDMDYLHHWTLALDFRILLRTLVVVFHDPHAY